MPKKKILSLFKAFLCLPLLLGSLPHALAQEANASDEWYPFHFPAKLDPDAPINIGKLVLDAPAGKHGFVKVNGADFIFEDGTPARFWGTNLCFNANFPDKKNAELLADRIAYFGFNAVRLHHMDFYHAPKGIFEDIDPAFKDPQDKRTTTLSKRQLDRLDYLIFLFKERGIYVDINLLVARHFTEADGVKNGKQLGMAAKPASMFDPKLIELQKDYARDLLTHLNPYTKTRYVDEPAVALIEITNENSILKAWEDGSIENLPEYYTRQLDERWNVWLKSKYTTIENLKKAWSVFATTKTTVPSTLNTPNDITLWGLEEHATAKASLNIQATTAHINRITITGTPWHLQYRRNGFNVATNTNYLVTFTASAENNTTLSVVSQQNFAPYENLGLQEAIKLTPVPQVFSIPFYPKQDCPNAKIGFIIGAAQGKIIIENISVKELLPDTNIATQNHSDFSLPRPAHKLLRISPVAKQNDIIAFYSDLQTDYLNDMRSFLINDLQIKVPVTGIGGMMSKNDASTQTQMDFIDKHAYWDHPTFPNKHWDKNDFRIHNKSIFSSPDLGIIGPLTLTGRQTPDKPFTVTEWNHCYPNQYAYETPLLLAATARLEGWDALFQFAFSHGWEFEPKLDSIQRFFDIIANPQQLILNPFSSRIFLSDTKPVITHYDKYSLITMPSLIASIGMIKEKQIEQLNITPTGNGAVIQTDNYLFEIGDITNGNKGTTRQKKFEWEKSEIELMSILAPLINLKTQNSPCRKLK